MSTMSIKVRWILVSLLGLHSLAFAGGLPDKHVAPGCDSLKLVLDARLSPEVMAQEWASGESLSTKPAVLELHGCKGELLDRMILAAPLARLDPSPLRGTQVPTYLVTVDLTAPIGSYSGPLTMPIQLVKHKLKRAKAMTSKGRFEEINLALTGKAAWKKVAVNTGDDFISVRCQPEGDGFVISYARYHFTLRGWQVRVRSEPGFWESEGEFPDLKHFP